MSKIERNPLDVWLRFAPGEEGHTEDACDGDEVAYEANTYQNAEDEFTVEWYHNAVGQVSYRTFLTYAEATAWLESAGFQDFSS